MTPGLRKDFCVVYDHILFYACKSPDQTLGHTWSGLSAWWLQMTTKSSSSGVCVVMYGLTYSLYHPQAYINERSNLHSCPMNWWQWVSKAGSTRSYTSMHRCSLISWYTWERTSAERSGVRLNTCTYTKHTCMYFISMSTCVTGTNESSLKNVHTGAHQAAYLTVFVDNWSIYPKHYKYK